jgi:hypothetical protein
MGGPVNAGPNDPRGNIVKPVPPATKAEGGPNAGGAEPNRGPEDPRGDSAAAAAAGSEAD